MSNKRRFLFIFSLIMVFSFFTLSISSLAEALIYDENTGEVVMVSIFKFDEYKKELVKSVESIPTTQSVIENTTSGAIVISSKKINNSKKKKKMKSIFKKKVKHNNKKHQIKRVNRKCNSRQSYYNKENLELMAHLIYAEVGTMSDECQQITGRVCINILENNIVKGATTIKDVIYSKNPHCYACADNNALFKKNPDKRAYKNAKKVLKGKIDYYVPEECIYQAGFIQGSKIFKIFDSPYGSKVYICYK